MFGQDPNDPTPADEGRFLSEVELLAWHRSMQQKYPQIFTADDKLFGDLGRQHSMGTKLMSWFDDDPNKPIRLEVRGSKWKVEFGGATSPVYVVKARGDHELSLIELTSAHEEGGWQVGWDLTPPTAS